MKTLIIDDDHLTRKILLNAVEGLGHSVIQSGNGRHGWETLWENQDVAMIITDMIMPDMDGTELIHLIRGSTPFKSIPIIIVSGVLLQEDVKSLTTLGPSRFSKKPIDIEEIKAHITALTKG